MWRFSEKTKKKINNTNEFWVVKTFFLAEIHFADKQTVGYVKCLFSPVSSVLSNLSELCVPDRNMDFNNRCNQVYYYYYYYYFGDGDLTKCDLSLATSSQLRM